jgi:drug/metabolite transporter (DMT)-like permease
VNTISSDRTGASAASVALTALAMLAFAANSLLCRMALGHRLMDAASFAAIRVISGAVVLSLMVMPRRRMRPGAANWRSVLALSAYMIFFSFAYLTLSAGTGALILFGAVQLTMFAVSLRAGEHVATPAWVGLAIAVLGLVYLVSPGLAAPDPPGAAAMAIAGAAWGYYSLLGRSASDPLEATAGNFLYSVPLMIVVALAFKSNWHVTSEGVVLAMLSGGIASGLGYVIWYAALRGLTGTRAATVQLSVPVIAAFAGVVLLGEQVTPRLLLASAATLGGVWIVLAQRTRQAAPARS